MPDSTASIDPCKEAFIRGELDLVARRVRTLDALRALTLAAAAGQWD